MLLDVVPYWPVNPSLAQSPWLIFQVDITRCLWAVLPAACLWGASFPLALGALASPGLEAGRLVGALYAANTAGAIVGAAAASLFTVPAWGAQGTQRALMFVAALAGTIALTQRPLDRARLALLFTAAGATAVLVTFVPTLPGLLVAYGRFTATTTDPVTVLYVGEGINSSVAVTQMPNGVRNFHVSGKIEASSQADDMRLQRMLGHLPALIHPSPQSVLVIGFGAGVTAGSFVPYPEVRRIVIAEIEPLIPRVVATFFTRQNNDVLHDARTEVVYDDARHYVMTTGERFDVITSDPIHPWVKGSAALYTREYFELLKSHLKPGGLLTQWVPLYESDLDVVKSEIATFASVFPDATIWANLQNQQGYDLVVLGHASPSPIDVDAVEARFADAAHARAAASLRAVGFSDVWDLFATYAGRASALRGWLQDAQVNRDGNLRLQYLAGLQSNRYDSDAIYTDMVVGRRKYPDDLFIGRAASIEALRKRIAP